MKKTKVLSIFLASALFFSLLPAMAFAAEATASAEQNAINDRTVTVSVPELGDLEDADSIEITATMEYDGTVTEEFTSTVSISDIEGNAFEVELPYFGKWNVSLDILKGSESLKTIDDVEADVAADDFNIICGTATTDVLIEALKFFNGGIDSSIPTIATLNRYWQFDWDNLPENMYRNPLLSAADNGKAQNWDLRMDHMKQYVADLYEINPDTHFNFYVTDYHMYAFAKICYSNGIPAENYTITMVTDGSGSYTAFHEAYGDADDAAAVHEQLVEEFTDFREGVYDGSVSDYKNLPSGDIRIYNYALLDAEEAAGATAYWWVVRKSTDTFGLEKDADFQGKVLGDARVSNNYINGQLSSMSNAGKDEEFKALYKFVDDDFQKARDEGKKIMMFLGTTASIEKAIPVMDYVNFIVEFYGDEYAYFYKGHPGNYLMDLDRYKKPYLDIGVGVLEASIAAELFIYFNPDIAISGYESSLFQNMGDDDQDIALFRRTQEIAEADVNLGNYAGKMDIFISDMTKPEDPFTFNGDSPTATVNGMAVNYGNQPDASAYEKPNKVRTVAETLIPEGEENDHNYLIQFNNSASNQVCDYDYAIWNADKKVIHYIDINLSGESVNGDVNGDGKVTAIDKAILNRYLAGWKGYDERIADWDAADINKDGNVDAKDKAILNRYLAGWQGYDQYFEKNVESAK